MKRLKHIVSGIVWTLAGLYFLLIIAIHIPAVQGFIGSQVSALLSSKLGTKVTVERVDAGFLNRIIIDDMKVYDQTGQLMIRSARVSAKVDYYPLLNGKISVSSAQLFGFHGLFYRTKANAPANYQFVLDSLASKDTTTRTPLDLRIRSLIVRHGHVVYDRHDVPQTKGKLNLNHLNVTDLSAHAMLNHLTDSSIDVHVKKLSLREKSGLQLDKLSLKLSANRQKAQLTDFIAKLPESEILIDSIVANYEIENKHLKKMLFTGVISESKITPADVKCMVPSLATFNNPICLQSQFSGSKNQMSIRHLYVYSTSGEIDINMSGGIAWPNRPEVSFPWKDARWWAKLNNFDMNGSTIKFLVKNLKGRNIEIPEEFTRWGDIHYKGELSGGRGSLLATGKWMTDAGDMNVRGKMVNHDFQADIETGGFALNKIFPDKKLGMLVANINVKGRWTNRQLHTLSVKGNIPRFEYNAYVYRDLAVNGSLQENTLSGIFNMNDENGNICIEGTANISKHSPTARVKATVRHLNLQALKITDKFGNAVFGADIDTDVEGHSLNTLNGTISLSNLTMKSAEKDFYVRHILLSAYNKGNEKSLSVYGDFGNIDVNGQFDYATISQSVTNFIGSKLPTLPGLPPTTNARNNHFTFKADITDTGWLDVFFNIPLTLTQPAHIEGGMDDDARKMNLQAHLPDFSYNGSRYEKAILNLRTSDVEEVVVSSHVRKLMDNGHKLDLSLNANAANNELITSINWTNNLPHPIKGTLNSTTDFFKTDRGVSAAHIKIHPSKIIVNDTVWHVQPSDVIYQKNRLLVDYFAIEHDRQHVIVTGLATQNENDSIVADLQDVDVDYILKVVNFHAVDFGGKASGKACVKSAFKNPEAYANLSVRDFCFQEGRMGTLTANARWNKREKRIDIQALAHDEKEVKTVIQGHVSPVQNHIDLQITAKDTRLGFLKSFCASFMDNIEARASGTVRLAGSLDEINLTGLLVANGNLDITSLNTRYRLENDTIRLVPNEIVFNNDTVYDRNGNIGIVNGALHHKHLTQLTFDLDIAAHNLLCYDFHDYGGSTFYGTVYGTGNCAIKGRNGRIDFDVNVTPGKGSFIEYDATSPDAITNQEFITWRDKTDSRSKMADEVKTEDISMEKDISSEQDDIKSDLHINFLINATPDVTLRVLMDKASGDLIALNGTGAIRASYYNKGAFDMFGTYRVDHGVYRLTVQNIIKKEFQFQPNSTIVFGGDPYLAALNLKALYVVNGVSLSDLQIGKSFSSNNIRVDCMMNIGGTPQSPRVDFDLDLPTVNTEAKQMVRSLINSEEEMNQQVIYLLSIGRFYTQGTNNARDNANQSQTSLAMQSLLSGTISQQINSVLGSLVKSNNWNFGTNISTGDEGWNNAEYEGLLSGRLLNNRLLINGQFGYRDNANATTGFIGDFDVRYLLFPNGNLSIKVYNQTNDRYFTKSNLNTQGIGLIIKTDFNNWRDLFFKSRKKNATSGKF